MTKDVTLSLRIDRKLSDKLDKHAKISKRSKSSLAAIAIQSFLDIEAQELARIRKSMAKAKAGGPFVAHEDVMRWINSWGTPDELPPPKAKIKF
jgi:RHH-type transcriptional regulator, rel operon repressor / antitoxin RelB